MTHPAAATAVAAAAPVLLQEAHAALQAVAASIATLQTRDGPRKRLGDGAAEALHASALGTRDGARVAASALADVAPDARKFGHDRQHPNAAAVAAVVPKAGGLAAAALAAWSPDPPPPPPALLTMGTGPAVVQLRADGPVSLTVAASRQGGRRDVPLQVRLAFSGLPDGLAVVPPPLVFPASASVDVASVVVAFPPVAAQPPGTPDILGSVALVFDQPALFGPGAGPTSAALTFKAPVIATTKGSLTFAAPIGTILRDSAAETTVMVQVERQNVSTKDAATAPVDISQLPPDVLKVVGPADFKAGSKYGYAPVVLHPYGAAVVAAPVRRTPGRADLVPTDWADLGAVPSQDFLVQDGQDIGPGGNPFHDRVSAEVLAVLGYPFGWSMNWSAGDVAAWTALTGRRPYVCSGGSHNGGRISTWDACMGGPVLSNKAGYDSGGVAGSQLDYKGTNFEVAMTVIPHGGGLLVPTWWFTPDQGRGSYASLAGSAQLYDRAYGFGRRACAEMIQAGKDPGSLAPRLDKELNQDPSRAPHDASEVLEYAAAEATFIQGFNDGYTARQPVKPLFILGLARHDQIGPLENWVAKDASGNALIAAIDISAHLPGDANNLAGRPIAEQAAAVRQWLRGGYDGRPCYSHDHADPQYCGKVVAAKYGLAITNTETSPRNEPKLACNISAGFWAGMFGFWGENAAVIGAVGVFATSAIQPAAIPGWSDGIAALGRFAKGATS